MEKSPKRGVIYISTGGAYCEEVLISAESLKRHNPELHTTLYTDQPLAHPAFNEVIEIKSMEGLGDRIPIFLKSPYENTLFLDTDTYITDSIEELFPLLQKFDLALAHTACRLVEEHPLEIDGKYRGIISKAYPQYNCGVILFRRNEQVDNLFQMWRKLHVEMVAFSQAEWLNDQPAFRVATYLSDVHIATLTPEYNFRACFPQYANGKVKIIHMRLPEVLEEKKQAWESFERYLNKKTCPRLWDPEEMNVLVPR